MLCWTDTAFRLYFAFLVALTIMFSCALPCQSSFSTQKGLRRHQIDCKEFAVLQGLRLEQRRANAVKRSQGAAPQPQAKKARMEV